MISYLKQKSNSRTNNIQRSIISIMLFRAINVIISFLVVPITINYLSPVEYGVWLTLSSFLVWLDFFDIGIANGLRNKLTECIAKKDFALAKSYVSTTYFILTLISVLLFLLFLSLSCITNWNVILKINPEIQISNVVLLIVFFYSIKFVYKTIGTILIADQQPGLDAMISAISSVITFIVVFTLTRLSNGSLFIIAGVFSFIPSFTYIFSSLFFFKKKYSLIKPSFKSVRKDLVGNLFGLGIKFFIIQISCLVIFSSTNFLIIRWFGPESVTQYNIAFKYFYIINLSFTIIVTPLWSAFTEAYVNNDLLWIKRTIKKMEVIALFMIISVLVMIYFANNFYSLWIGNKIKVPDSLTISVGFYTIAFIILSTYNYVINGTGKILIQTIVSIVVMILYPILSYYLSNLWGPSGVVYSSAIVMIPMIILSYIQYNKIVNEKLNGLWNK